MSNKIREPLSFAVFAFSAILGLGTFFFEWNNAIHTVAVASAVYALYLFPEKNRWMRLATLFIVIIGLFNTSGYTFPEPFSLLFAR